MNRATYDRESSLNRIALEHLRESIRREYAGMHVALAHGKVIGAAKSFDATRSLVEQLDIVPEYYLVFPADDEPNFDLVYDLTGAV